MSGETLRKRLAAILAADAAGYSRLMATDERGAVAALDAARGVFRAQVVANQGRVIDTAGDSVLAVFETASGAVAAALAIQQSLAAASSDVSENRRMHFRIGIHLGEIMEKTDGTVYGDGVIIAARLEGLTDPGGVTISESMRSAVKGKVNADFEDLGNQTVKNIADPVHVYRLKPADPGDARGGRTVGHVDVSRPDKPSIAVLPFSNMSGDSEQEYFADGMTEDIITGLSRFRSLSVVARSSTFAYKSKSVDVRELARALGVRYVLEGSVRRSGNRIRITGQLVDGATGNHLWVERFDRELQDMFAVQDEVTEMIVAAIAPEIDDVERERAQRKPPGDLAAWERYQRALAAYYSSTEAGLRSAIEQFDEVNEVDPTFAPAFAMAAGARWRYVMHFAPEYRDAYLKQARDKAYKAISLDPRDPIGLRNAGRVHSLLGQHEIALSKIKEAIALNPNDAMSHYVLGAILCSAGRANDALPHIDHAMRLSPHDIFLTGMLTHRAFVLFALERYKEAFEWAQRARLSPNPRPMTFALLTAVLIKLGQPDDAKAVLDELMIRVPQMSCAKIQENSFGGADVMERMGDAMREAGLPE